MSDTISKAIEALESALNYIDESPCDPDITTDQIVAYDRFLKSNAVAALAELKALQSGEPVVDVNQQLLEALRECLSTLSNCGLENSDAYQQALAALLSAGKGGDSDAPEMKTYRCVTCNVSGTDDGLCDAHKYDEQLSKHKSAGKERKNG